MNNDLKQLLQICELTNTFNTIKRSTIRNKDGTSEDNAQHSFQLTLVAWYISDKENLGFNTERLLKYSLVHDLVAIYSGTFPAYDIDPNIEENKKQRELDAWSKLQKNFKDSPDLLNSLQQYNQREDQESKFIYALDKLLPIISIEVNNHYFYFQNKVTYEDMLKVTDKKIQTDPTVAKYFKLLSKYLKEDAQFFWPDNQERDYSK